MKKTTAILLAFFILSAMLMGCASQTIPVKDTADTSSTGNTPTEKTTIRLGGLKGPTSMGMVKLLKDNEDGKALNNYDFAMSGSADELTPKILKGELDILAVPVNLGGILYNNSESAVQLLADRLGEAVAA